MQLKIGKDQSFFLLLESQADVAAKSAEAFRVACSDFRNIDTHCAILKKLEQDGDDFTHRLQDHVASSFITPIDKEDLRELSQTLDDITDAIEAIIARVKIYRLTEPRKDLGPLTELLVKVTEVVQSSVGELKTGWHSESLNQKLLKIHELEDESDDRYRHALETLFFVDGLEPLEVIKWKEIYDRIEIAMDDCEDVAKIIGTFTVKYS